MLKIFGVTGASSDLSIALDYAFSHYFDRAHLEDLPRVTLLESITKWAVFSLTGERVAGELLA